jgi:hypothetical protein
MATLLHGDIQLALKTATEAPYQIRKGTRGINVWQNVPKMGWVAIATFTNRDIAEDFVLGQIAVMDD